MPRDWLSGALSLLAEQLGQDSFPTSQLASGLDSMLCLLTSLGSHCSKAFLFVWSLYQKNSLGSQSQALRDTESKSAPRPKNSSSIGSS